MRILYVIPYTPTPIRTRPYNLLRAMLQRGHLLTLATVWESPSERDILLEWQEQGVEIIAEPLERGRKLANLARTGFSLAPFQARFAWQPVLAERILQRISAPTARLDLAHVEHLRGAEYGAAILKQGLLPVVWDSVDCISLLFQRAAQASQSRFGRWAARVELPRTRRYERQAVRRFARTLVTSPGDQEALLNLARKARKADQPPPRVEVLPNGVDLDYFRPLNTERQTDTIVMTGKMSYHANVTAAAALVNDVMPLVWAQHPQVKVVLAGSNPSAEVRALASRHPGRVVVTGAVPDLRPYLQLATLAVAPIIYGVGIQNKVLEALACGTPLVASPQAVSALPIRLGEEVVAADLRPGAGDGQAFATAIVQLLDDPQRRQRLGLAGRTYVERHHSWGKIAEQLEGIYRQVLRG